MEKRLRVFKTRGKEEYRVQWATNWDCYGKTDWNNYLGTYPTREQANAKLSEIANSHH